MCTRAYPCYSMYGSLCVCTRVCPCYSMYGGLCACTHACPCYNVYGGLCACTYACPCYSVYGGLKTAFRAPRIEFTGCQSLWHFEPSYGPPAGFYMTPSSDPSSWKVEAGGPRGIQGQPWLSETLPQNKSINQPSKTRFKCS